MKKTKKTNKVISTSKDMPSYNDKNPDEMAKVMEVQMGYKKKGGKKK